MHGATIRTLWTKFKLNFKLLLTKIPIISLTAIDGGDLRLRTNI